MLRGRTSLKRINLGDPFCPQFERGSTAVSAMLTGPQSVPHNRSGDAFWHFAVPCQGAPKMPKGMHGVTPVLNLDLLPQKQACIVVEPVCGPSLPSWDCRKEPSFGTIIHCGFFGRIHNLNARWMNRYVTNACPILQGSMQVMDPNDCSPM